MQNEAASASRYGYEKYSSSSSSSDKDSERAAAESCCSGEASSRSSATAAVVTSDSQCQEYQAANISSKAALAPTATIVHANYCYQNWKTSIWKKTLNTEMLMKNTEIAEECGQTWIHYNKRLIFCNKRYSKDRYTYKDRTLPIKMAETILKVQQNIHISGCTTTISPHMCLSTTQLSNVRCLVSNQTYYSKIVFKLSANSKFTCFQSYFAVRHGFYQLIIATHSENDIGP